MNHYYYNFPYTRYTRNKYILPGRSLLTRKEEIHPLVKRYVLVHVTRNDVGKAAQVNAILRFNQTFWNDLPQILSFQFMERMY